MIKANSDFTEIPTVGPTTARRLKSLGLNKVQDLLFYFPNRYQDFSEITPIKDIKPEEVYTIRGTLQLIKSRRSWKKRRLTITEAMVKDKTASIKIIWFNQPYLKKILNPGDEIILSGKVKMQELTLEFLAPSFEKVKKEQTHTGRIVPVYPLTSGLSQRQIRFFIKTALTLRKKIKETLPERITKKYQLMPLPEAIKQIHFPDSFEKLEKASKRLKFGELFYIQIQSLQNKRFIKQTRAPVINYKDKYIDDFKNNLPFKLTKAQEKASQEIIKDLKKGNPMNRLLEGDVGSGKTVVALMAAFLAIKNGFQVAFMAPTEILARQHYLKIKNILKTFNFSLGLLTSKLIKINDEELSKKKASTIIKKGGVNIVIGTHSIIQEKISFHNLAFVVVDEQHRFGVEQRKALRDKSSKKHDLAPHLLSMTATPIPRSLALTVYADLDLSIIDQMPQGRKKIKTEVIEPEKRKKTYKFIKEEIKNGNQVFVVCPLIEPSDKLGVKSVKEEYEKIAKDIFPDFKVARLHGKMKTQEKEKIMDQMKNKAIDILVSTSVIEVGIDIPDATVMMIEGAERFGLAQLHQFRGRVGRSEKQSFCFVFTESESPKNLKRLEALEKSQDGFKLAEYDLKMRGPGVLTGAQQSGLPDFKMATLADVDIIKMAREAAQDLTKKDPALKKYYKIKQKAENLYKDTHWE
ncbi:MAG: ATP-dependent DNA helicase RecG [Patescibacteria group bacterium]|nr:ATP-dependent DNA helicase RecG [Patescibacteria group bacterium]MDZ7798004.1 ATP-dependent DNA helicase RecG [Patescibacteria group bacterium]